MDVEIRKAVKADAEGILALIQELATFEQEPDALILDKKNIEEDGFGAQILCSAVLWQFSKEKSSQSHFFIRDILLGKELHCIWKILL